MSLSLKQKNQGVIFETGKSLSKQEKQRQCGFVLSHPNYCRESLETEFNEAQLYRELHPRRGQEPSQRWREDTKAETGEKEQIRY